MARPLVILDTETTGLEPTIHEIIEVACLQVTPEFDVVTTYESKIRPENLESADPRALEINGFTPEEWEGAPSLVTVMTTLAELTGGCILVGHNIKFDIAFLEESMRRVGVTPNWHWTAFDSKTVAWTILRKEVHNLGLDNLCEHLGIDIPGHRALNDCERVRQMLVKLLN